MPASRAHLFDPLALVLVRLLRPEKMAMLAGAKRLTTGGRRSGLTVGATFEAHIRGQTDVWQHNASQPYGNTRTLTHAPFFACCARLRTVVVASALDCGSSPAPGCTPLPCTSLTGSGLWQTARFRCLQPLRRLPLQRPHQLEKRLCNGTVSELWVLTAQRTHVAAMDMFTCGRRHASSFPSTSYPKSTGTDPPWRDVTRAPHRSSAWEASVL